MKAVTIVVEKHPDTYVACPFGLKGVAVGQGDSYAAGGAYLKSALQFHVGSFGADRLNVDPLMLEGFMGSARVRA